MMPSEEFMELRDEILIQILGIDGSLPVYHSHEEDPDYVELPYGGVLRTIGKFAYRISLQEMELGLAEKPMFGTRLYYPYIGLEIDVNYSCGVPYDVTRYLYIANSSQIKLPSGVGIGSSVEDVVSAYGSHILPDFRPMLTSENVIALGSDLNGIYFVIRDGRVYSIYVATIREDGPSSNWITRTQWNLYPDRFYPDREYMEASLPDWP
jgi:hypothetical protein